MKVILRPGPYVCAEWKGGLPWWLLRKKISAFAKTTPTSLRESTNSRKQWPISFSDLTIARWPNKSWCRLEMKYGSVW